MGSAPGRAQRHHGIIPEGEVSIGSYIFNTGATFATFCAGYNLASGYDFVSWAVFGLMVLGGALSGIAGAMSE